MKKRILSFFLALVTVLTVIPVNILPVFAVDSEDTEITIEDMEVGKLYTAVWDYSEYDSFIPYKISDEDGTLEWKGWGDDVDYNDAFVSKSDFPQILIVKRIDSDDTYGVHVMNEDWPSDYDEYRYIEIVDITITGEYNGTLEDDNLIYGMVDILTESAGESAVTIPKGGKSYALAQYGDQISENARFQWQIKISDKNWANINDYVSPYAVLSEALLINNPSADGKATLRCIVTDGDKKYASDEITLSVSDSVPQSLSDIVTPKAYAPVQTIAEDAFQIAVNYVFARENAEGEHESAHTPFIVSLTGTETFTGKVNNPFIIGYTACELVADGTGTIEFNGKTYNEISAVTFNDVGLDDTDKQKVTVYYVPLKTNFTVEYYFQNIVDDGYSLGGMEVIKTKYADEAVGEGLDKDFYGFTPLFYDTATTVSGNGNTVIEIYYDRIYYLVEFNLDGGYGLMPYYVRYESDVMLTAPTKPGYSFKEPWQLDRVYTKDEDTDVETDVSMDDADISAAYKDKNSNTVITVKHNLNYTANWKAETTSYTIIYWVENADDDNFTLHSFTVVEGATPGDPVSASDSWTNSEKSYFTYNDTLSDHDVIIKGDGTTAVNVYYLRNYYTLTFNGSGGTCIRQEHTHDSSCPTGTCSLESHMHNAECGVASQTCGKEEHEHIKKLIANGGCLSCTISEHTSHTTDCIVCGLSEHLSHSTACYDGVGNAKSDNITVNAEETDGSIGNGSYYGIFGDGNKYIYINGTWYRYTGNTSAGSTASYTCSGLHSHVESCYSDMLHTHNETCFNCGKEQHRHTTTCYTYKCGIIAHSHGGDCVRTCQIPEHTHGSCGNNFQIISRKYGADIGDVWREIWTIFPNGERWDPSTFYDEVLVYLPFMPPANITFSKNTDTNKDTYILHYYLQSLGTSGTLYNGNYFDLNNTVNAKYGYLSKNEDFFDIVGFTQYTSNPTFNNNQINNGGGDVYLYYTRNIYDLKFVSNGVPLTALNKTLMYQQPIDASFEPTDIPYPTNAESGAVQFAGWYTTPTCADGTEFFFDGSTIMPLNGLTVYAKWEPTTHNVKVYRQESEIGSTESGKLLLDKTVEFGTQILEDELVEYTKPNVNYVFGGWYYIDADGNESRYDFNTMVVKHEYVIYAKWIKNVPIPYTVKYVTEVDGQMVEIADTEAGISLEGISKTFTAKAGADLNPPYNEWFFPNERYITHTMSANSDENVIEFVYETTDTIKYTITHVFKSSKLTEYLGSDTLVFATEYSISKGTDQFQASITEKFSDLVNESNVKDAAVAQKAGLSAANQTNVWNIVKTLTPDYYTQELELTINDEENVMTFNWEDLGTTSMYQVVYYTLDKGKTAGTTTNYSIHSTEAYKVAYDTTTEHTATWKNIYGFTPNEGISTVSGYLPADSSDITGLILELYYDREIYTYTVHHYVTGTTQELAADEEKTAYFEEDILISSVAKVFPGYTLYNGSETRTIGTDNYEFAVYYSPMKVDFRFQEAIAGRGTINVGNLTYEGYVGEAPDPDEATATAVPNAGYRFVGWYLDAACTQPVTTANATISNEGATILPLTPTPEMANTTVTFFALFEPTTRIFKNAGVADANQAFVYRIQGADQANANVDVTFIIIGNASATLAQLPFGNYIVTVTNWSWRYSTPALSFNGQSGTPDSNTFVITLDAVGDVTFDYTGKNIDSQWLTDNANGTYPTT